MALLADGPSVASTSSPLPVSVVSPRLFELDGDQLSFDDLQEAAEMRARSAAERAAAERAAAEQAAAKKPKPSKPAPRRTWRSTIALQGLDDWLDFLEAMLGTADVTDEMLNAAFLTLDELSEYERILPGFMGMDTLDPEQRFPWLAVVRDIAADEGFLHWELDFALVFARRGGFDLQVGNPPWVRPRWNEDAVLAEHEPWFVLEEKAPEQHKQERREKLIAEPTVRGYVLGELTRTSAQVAMLSSPQVYPLLTGTQPDLYRAFMCQVWGHASAAGTIGMLHPDTHFNGDKERALRAEAYRRLRVHGDFVNAGNRFFPKPVGRSTHFGVHVYGGPGEITFDHLSWLFSADALRLSKEAISTAAPPGIRYGSDWDERPHPARVITVNRQVLATWQRLLDEDHAPVEQGRLLFPVSTLEASAIEALATYPLRLGALDPQITPGLHESGSKAAGVIDYNRPDPATGREYRPLSWSEVILKGPQLGVANSMFKQPSQQRDRQGATVSGLDLTTLADTAVPETEYLRTTSPEQYRAAQDAWLDVHLLDALWSSPETVQRIRQDLAADLALPPNEVPDDAVEDALVAGARRPSTDFYRLAWRRQIAPDTERALYAALIPPGAAHIDAVHSLAMSDSRITAMVAGFWAALPMDYFVRTTGRGDLRVAGARAMPAPDQEHPLDTALLIRTLRLNCLTTAYSDLWADLFEQGWSAEAWACPWPDLPPLGAVRPDWTSATPLRTERARRAALVELDALVAVWLGVSASALVAMYRSRFPVLQDFEAVTWFDAQGRKIAGHPYAVGHGQPKPAWAELQAHLAEPERVGPPEGYTPPFYRADRETEMRQAHAVFQARLDAAVERGEWDPDRREVPTR